jgi:hypothetical protein
MRTQAQLCHIEASRCVVLVTALEGATVIASAFGEANNAEEAEDRAIARLHQRLETHQVSPAQATEPAPTPASAPTTASAPAHAPAQPRPASRKAIKATAAQPPAPKRVATTAPPPATGSAPKAKTEPNPNGKDPRHADPAPLDLPLLQAPEPVQPDQAPSEAPTDPDDWSDELAAIDLELQRIGWDRAQERNYLERAFGHGSRHRITRYSDLVAYIKRLQALEPGTTADQAPVPLRRSELISQGDQMLDDLQWEATKARTFLQDQLGASSRQSLSDEQLLAFNIMLENEIVNRSASTIQ